MKRQRPLPQDVDTIESPRRAPKQRAAARNISSFINPHANPSTPWPHCTVPVRAQQNACVRDTQTQGRRTNRRGIRRRGAPAPLRQAGTRSALRRFRETATPNGRRDPHGTQPRVPNGPAQPQVKREYSWHPCGRLGTSPISEPALRARGDAAGGASRSSRPESAAAKGGDQPAAHTRPQSTRPPTPIPTSPHPQE